mmetsp:Transcript_62434/g.160891  ORF Transcript_62434/g.160891 Transcript_62434/m.160891 type:complete len:110 (-) Transcript_62434:98-427(-)
MVKVVTPNGEQIAYEPAVDGNHNIAELKRRLAGPVGKAAHKIQIICNGEVQHDKCLVKDLPGGLGSQLTVAADDSRVEWADRDRGKPLAEVREIPLHQGETSSACCSIS